MPPTRGPAVTLAAVTLVLVTLAPPVTKAQEIGDAERGKIVFRTVGACVNCHGWAADGKTGVNLRAPTGSSLRETKLSASEIAEVIKCGRPGTAMPYHDRVAYRDDRCYGLVMSDFDPDKKPARGKTLGDADVANLVAYLETRVIGLGKPTREDCADFFDNPAAAACKNLK